MDVIVEKIEMGIVYRFYLYINYKMAYIHKKFCNCNRMGIIGCDICHMSHCSIECKEKDIYHKFFCKKEFCDSLKGLCFLYKFKKECWGRLNMSDCGFFRKYSKHVYSGLDYNDYGCVVCRTKIPCCGPGHKTELSFVKYGNEVFGYRCDECYNDGKILCPVTFREMGRCGMLKKRMIDNYMLMFGLDIDVPMDVKKYIMRFMRLSVCEC